MTRPLLSLLALLCLITSSAYALTSEPISDAPERTIADYIEDYIDIPDGALDWKLLGQTEMTNVEGKDKDGMDIQYFSPGFPLDLQPLDGQEILVKGFMFPLGAAEEQNLFLFGPFPLNCPYQYHVGPNLVIEVHADKNPTPFTYDPITLKGVFELVPSDPEYGVFYRLKDAKIVK
jgi:hypothetical protein